MQLDPIHLFLEWAKQGDWKVEKKETEEIRLPKEILNRYPNLHEDFLNFLSKIDSCMNEDGTVWFLCQQDYHGILKDGFRWDFYEAGDDLSSAAQSKAQYWKNHFPFLLSVRFAYAYYALCLIDGSIVHGSESPLESSRKIADSFHDFLLKVARGEILL